jgi:hypothetical protein
MKKFIVVALAASSLMIVADTASARPCNPGKAVSTKPDKCAVQAGAYCHPASKTWTGGSRRVFEQCMSGR